MIGMPSAKWGERPRAFVVVRSGAEATSGGVLEHVPRGLIARYKVPDGGGLRGCAARTATGKIRKNELRDTGMAGGAP